MPDPFTLRTRTADWSRGLRLLAAGGLSVLGSLIMVGQAADPLPVAAAPAPVAPTLLEPITAVVKKTDSDVRRDSTAGKIVFGREELDRYGDSTLGEVLKRLPGVTLSGTPGRGGEIRMRGLGNGYTMILLNGDPVPRGFSIDSIPPEQIERIEIMRAPVAEFSARAIAGTINIVLRESFTPHESEARPAMGLEGGVLQPSTSLQHGDKVGSVNYNLSANLAHRNLPSDSQTQTRTTDPKTGAPVLQQNESDRNVAASNALTLGGRINWQLRGADSASFQPFLSDTRTTTVGSLRLDQPLGPAAPPYADATYRSDTSARQLGGNGTWKIRLGKRENLELRLNLGQYQNATVTTRDEVDAAGVSAHRIQSDIGITDRSHTVAAKYTLALASAQQLAAGVESESRDRQERSATLQDGFNPLARYGDAIQATVRRNAAFVQDDWTVSPLWSAYAGLRWEQIETSSSSAVTANHDTSTVLSPLLHSVWRLTEEGKDQVRMALTRSYREPSLGNLVAVPVLSSIYPVPGSNTANSPDAIGSPGLKPELAWGLDVAIEHYFPAGGLLSASAFQRSINDLIRTVTSLQTVAYSSAPRWVAAPQNVGHAVARGIELEAKLRLDEWVRDAPKVNLRANYSHFWSSVDGVPGPDNRLDQQARETANVGLDYRMTVLPLTLGGNFNWTPAFTVQQTDTQRYVQGPKRIVDVYAVWKFNTDSQVRVSASNLTHADYLTGATNGDARGDQFAQTVRKTYPSVTARWEIRF